MVFIVVNGLEKLEDSHAGNSTQQGEPHTPLGLLVTLLPVWDGDVQLRSVSGAVAAGTCGLGFYPLRKLFSICLCNSCSQKFCSQRDTAATGAMLSSGYKMAPETSTETYLSNG